MSDPARTASVCDAHGLAHGSDPSLDQILAGSPFHAYSYSYPHKTAYRELLRPVSLARQWSEEPLHDLFLYVHVPFCEMRCGFCNLFTTTNPESELTDRWLATLEKQFDCVASALEEAGTARGESPHFSRAAFGGGTPTYLRPDQMERLFRALEQRFGIDFARTPTSLETSPKTATPARLRLAAERGVERVSMGVQSMSRLELSALGRPQNQGEVVRALDLFRELQFPVLNVDLIYGMADQTPESFVESIETLLAWRPEEIYLYPLYVRPLTGLGRKRRNWDDHRLACHRAGRNYLRDHGYEQVSLRMFRLPVADKPDRPSYRCQDDGLVGLGCGARSYTRTLHYSDEWAVGRGTVLEIVNRWVDRDPSRFDHAWHGVHLDTDEQKRRWVIQSMLVVDGLELADYRTRFQSDLLLDFPQLRALLDYQLALLDDATIRLTPAGLERSDSIGPWLYSPTVRKLSEEYELR